jgi:hypothetical protein
MSVENSRSTAEFLRRIGLRTSPRFSKTPRFDSSVFLVHQMNQYEPFPPVGLASCEKELPTEPWPPGQRESVVS